MGSAGALGSATPYLIPVSEGLGAAFVGGAINIYRDKNKEKKEKEDKNSNEIKVNTHPFIPNNPYLIGNECDRDYRPIIYNNYIFLINNHE